ncbi:MAG: hypothetical protein MKZ66_06800 [Acidimicrobiales bacterium]|nr:hypothetical protein [Acidimicrobiales bacterium]
MFDDEFAYRYVEDGYLVGEDPHRGRGLAEGPADLIVWPGSAEMAWGDRDAACSS